MDFFWKEYVPATWHCMFPLHVLIEVSRILESARVHHVVWLLKLGFKVKIQWGITLQILNEIMCLKRLFVCLNTSIIYGKDVWCSAISWISRQLNAASHVYFINIWISNSMVFPTKVSTEWGIFALKDT